jgi:microcystin-dependent protein
MAVSSFKISDDLNLDGVIFNLSGAASGQVLAYQSSSSSFVPTTETPVGTIIMHAGSSVPSGWLLCDGQQVSSSSSLGVILGTKFNTGGETAGNVRVPNLVTRIPIGMTSNTANSLTSSTSAIDTFNHSHTATYGTNGVAVSLAHNHTSANDGAHTHNVTSDDKGNHSHTGATGAGGAHTHTYNTKLANPANAFTSYSDNSHTHSSTANDANHSHNADGANISANHTHTDNGSTSLSHTHAISSISSSTQNTSLSNHGHGTFAVMQVIFLIKA